MRFDWRHQYDDERDALERKATDIDFTGQISMTKQEFTDDANLNITMARFGITDGALPPVAHDPRLFGDFTSAVDLHTALDRIRAAWDMFDTLPAALRTRFENDPVKLYDWVNDPTNTQEALDLKILSQEGAQMVPKTLEERRALEVEQLNQRIKELESVPAALPAGTTPPATTTTP